MKLKNLTIHLREIGQHVDLISTFVLGIEVPLTILARAAR
jgi:hypothetical protein